MRRATRPPPTHTHTSPFPSGPSLAQILLLTQDSAVRRSTAPSGCLAEKQQGWGRDVGCGRAWRKLETHTSFPLQLGAASMLFACCSISSPQFWGSVEGTMTWPLLGEVLSRRSHVLPCLIPAPCRQQALIFICPYLFIFSGCSQMRSEVKLVLGGKEQLHPYPLFPLT